MGASQSQDPEVEYAPPLQPFNVKISPELMTQLAEIDADPTTTGTQQPFPQTQPKNIEEWRVQNAINHARLDQALKDGESILFTSLKSLSDDVSKFERTIPTLPQGVENKCGEVERVLGMALKRGDLEGVKKGKGEVKKCLKAVGLSNQ